MLKRRDQRGSAEAESARLFFKKLKEKHGIKDVSQMIPHKPGDELLPLSPILVVALKSATNKNTSKRSREQLISYCLRTESCNCREVVGVVCHLVGVRTKGQSAKRLWLAFMNMCVRLKWAEDGQHDEDLAVLVDAFDDIICD